MTDENRTSLERLQRRSRIDPETVPLEALLEALDREDVPARERTVTALYHVSKAAPGRLREAVPRLSPLLADERATTRTKAAATLSNVADSHPDAVRPHADALADRLDDRSAAVTRGTAGALRRLAADDPAAVADAIERVVPLLSAESEETRRDAARVLEAVSADRPERVVGSLDALCLLLCDPREDADVRYDPSQAGERSTPADQLRGYRTLVTDPAGTESNVRAREAAARAMATVAAAESVPAADAFEPHLPRLFVLLEDPNPLVRASSAGVLAYVAEDAPEAVRPAEDALVDLLEHPIAVSGNAIWALGFVGSPRARAALSALVEREDVSRTVRETAESALERLEAERGPH